MIQENYKEITKLLNEEMNSLMKEVFVFEKGVVKSIVFKLANYFEKIDKFDFNKEQFLKDCGVE